MVTKWNNKQMERGNISCPGFLTIDMNYSELIEIVYFTTTRRDLSLQKEEEIWKNI